METSHYHRHLRVQYPSLNLRETTRQIYQIYQVYQVMTIFFLTSTPIMTTPLPIVPLKHRVLTSQQWIPQLGPQRDLYQL